MARRHAGGRQDADLAGRPLRVLERIRVGRPNLADDLETVLSQRGEDRLNLVDAETGTRRANSLVLNDAPVKVRDFAVRMPRARLGSLEWKE
jgi:hypothetical protein